MKKKTLKLVSWNVNGIRSVAKKGFAELLSSKGELGDIDVLCVQETKAQEDQLGEELLLPDGFVESEFSSAERKGYSGVASFYKSKLEPSKVKKGMGIEKFDSEGRIIESHHKLGDLEFILFNIYFPNGGASEERLNYKLEFYDEFLKYVNKLRKKGKKIIITGDYNTAHNAIDLARPKQNEDTSGFMPIEREWLDKMVSDGYLDTFRHFNSDPEYYTWWSFRTAARKRNVGWRIDYFWVSENLKPHLKNADILTQIMGSDHCPVMLELSLHPQ